MTFGQITSDEERKKRQQQEPKEPETSKAFLEKIPEQEPFDQLRSNLDYMAGQGDQYAGRLGQALDRIVGGDMQQGSEEIGRLWAELRKQTPASPGQGLADKQDEEAMAFQAVHEKYYSPENYVKNNWLNLLQQGLGLGIGMIAMHNNAPGVFMAGKGLAGSGSAGLQAYNQAYTAELKKLIDEASGPAYAERRLDLQKATIAGEAIARDIQSGKVKFKNDAELRDYVNSIGDEDGLNEEGKRALFRMAKGAQLDYTQIDAQLEPIIRGREGFSGSMEEWLSLLPDRLKQDPNVIQRMQERYPGLQPGGQPGMGGPSAPIPTVEEEVPYGVTPAIGLEGLPDDKREAVSQVIDRYATEKMGRGLATGTLTGVDVPIPSLSEIAAELGPELKPILGDQATASDVLTLARKVLESRLTRGTESSLRDQAGIAKQDAIAVANVLGAEFNRWYAENPDDYIEGMTLGEAPVPAAAKLKEMLQSPYVEVRSIAQNVLNSAPVQSEMQGELDAKLQRSLYDKAKKEVHDLAEIQAIDFFTNPGPAPQVKDIASMLERGNREGAGSIFVSSLLDYMGQDENRKQAVADLTDQDLELLKQKFFTGEQVPMTIINQAFSKAANEYKIVARNMIPRITAYVFNQLGEDQRVSDLIQDREYQGEVTEAEGNAFPIVKGIPSGNVVEMVNELMHRITTPGYLLDMGGIASNLRDIFARDQLVKVMSHNGRNQVYVKAGSYGILSNVPMKDALITLKPGFATPPGVEKKQDVMEMFEGRGLPDYSKHEYTVWVPILADPFPGTVPPTAEKTKNALINMADNPGPDTVHPSLMIYLSLLSEVLGEEEVTSGIR